MILPLVGRSVESALLTRQLESASAGHPKFVFVVGEPGIGKTRLLDEAAGSARDRGIRVLRGRAACGRPARMRPFTEALLGLARQGWMPSDDLGPYRAVLGQLVPDWRADAASTRAAEPFIYGEAILRVLGSAKSGATLLILEDLHDADPDTIATLEYLLDNAAGQSLAVFCTIRDVACPALDLADYACRRDADSLLGLTRLDREGTAALSAALLETETRFVGADLCDALFQDGVGNPLVVTEILRDLVARQALVQRDGEWTVADREQPHTPRSLARGIADQLRRKDPVARNVLQAAAVLRDEFRAEIVGAVARVEESDLWHVLDAAVGEQLLVPVDREGWFRFRHPLLERAVRDQLTPSARKALALAGAAEIEARGTDTEEWRIPAAVLRETAGDNDNAGALFAAAGMNAADRGSPALAVDLLQRALGCLPSEKYDAAWAELTGALVTALGTAGRHREAIDHVDEVAFAAKRGLPRESAADLHLRFARVALRACPIDEVSPHVQAARQAIGDLRADAQRAELDAIEALVTVDTRTEGQQGKVRAEVLAQRAIGRAREANLPAVECDALLTLGYLYGNHRPDEALDSYQRAYSVARVNDLAALRSEALLLLGAHRWMWHVDPVGLETAVAEAYAAGAVMEARLAQLSLAVDSVFRTRFDDARDLVQTAWSDIAKLKLPKLGSYALAVKAVMHAHSGQDEESAAAVCEFERWRGENEDEVPLVRGLVLGMSALLRGDMASGREHFAALRAQDGGFRPTKYYLCGEFGLALLAETADGSAGWDEYRSVASQTASRLPWNLQFTEFARAVLCGRDGDLAGAEAALSQALEIAAPFPLARHLGLRIVSSAAARHRWGDPVRWLQDAEAFFKAANIPSAARCCRDESRLIGGPTRQWRQGSPDVPRDLWTVGVTVREYEVLQLVAQHRTNREIAAALHLSHRTVERHVANLLAKTGTANRRELTGRAAVEIG